MFVNEITKGVLDDLYPFIKEYESFRDKAYNLGDGKITIGYGSTVWRRPDGSVIRNVKMGDTITVVEAENQMRYYYIDINKSFGFRLKSKSLSVDSKLLAALLNWVYVFGHGFLTWNVCDRILAYGNNNSNFASVAYYAKMEIIKQLKLNPSKYKLFGLGWSRRATAMEDLILGTLKKRTWYDQNIKKPL